MGPVRVVDACAESGLFVAFIELKDKRNLKATAQVVVEVGDDPFSELEDPVLREDVAEGRMLFGICDVGESEVAEDLLGLELCVFESFEVFGKFLTAGYVVGLGSVAVDEFGSEGGVDGVDGEVDVDVEFHVVGDGVFLASEDEVHAERPSFEELVLGSFIEGLEQLDDREVFAERVGAALLEEELHFLLELVEGADEAELHEVVANGRVYCALRF